MRHQSILVLLMTGASVAGISAPAFAQVASNNASQVEQVVVTGSRVGHTTFETPTPVTSISEKDLEAKAPTTVFEMLTDIPAVRPDLTAGSGRNIGVSNFNARGLGASRTLVLLDGQRLMDSSPVGGFDLNVIPAPLVGRIEIVTAGASSVYGSDAITGVVNLILTRPDGAKFDTQYNVSSRGDAQSFSASLVYGKAFAEGKGKLTFSASYLDRPNILYQGTRPWGAQGITLIPNSAWTATNGMYHQLIVPDVQLSMMTYGGVITSAGPLQNIQFGVNGAQSPFVQGTNVSSVWMQGGQGISLQGKLGPLLPSEQQISTFSRVEYDITPAISSHLDLLATWSANESTNNYNYSNATLTIQRDNAFLPSNILATMVANKLQTITMGRLNPELGLNRNVSRNQYYRLSGGFNGTLFGDWKWDAGADFTYAVATNVGFNNRIEANFTKAVDSVVGPLGQPICRSTLTDPTNGCVPANVFGTGALSSAVVAYAGGTSWQRSYSNRVGAHAGVTGNAGETWAGPISTAAGIEFRADTVNSKSDPISNINGWRQGTFAGFRGDENVVEGYAEASIPLAQDISFAKDAGVDLAARYVDYSISGSAFVWKVGLNWAFDENVRFRGTYSKDFRAPSINDLYSASSLRAGNNVIDSAGTGKTAVVNTVSGGNPSLKPEIAHTISVGVVVTPAALPGLEFSTDYYDIRLGNALSTLGAQTVVDQCAAGGASFCAALTRNSAGVLTQVVTTQFNAQALKTDGVDVEVSYKFGLDGLVSGWEGQMTLREVMSYVDNLITQTNGSPALNTAGQLNGGTPHWRGTTTVGYDNGPFDARILFRLVGGGKFNNTYGPLELNRNDWGAYLYADLAASYNISDSLQLYGKINNVLDTSPPNIAANTITIAGAAGTTYHDFMGRMFGIGVRYRW